MEKFSIETRDDDEFIISYEHGFTLKVIPPGNQENHYYTPRKEVAAIYLEDLNLPWPERFDYVSDETYEEALIDCRLKFGLEHYV